MQADFFVKQCYDVGGVSLVLAGNVESGEIAEGSIGVTSKGKKFTVVKIEKDGDRVPVALRKEKVNLSIKNITRVDIRVGEIIHF